MKRREFIAGVGGVCAAWSLTVRGQHTAVPLVRLLAGVLLAVGFSLPTGTSAGGQTAPVTSDDKFVDGLIADLGFQPRELIERVRYLVNVPYEAPTQRRLSYCVDGYADKIAKDVKLHERVVSEVDQRACARFQLCLRPDQQRVNQSENYAKLLRVLASEMRGERRAELSPVFMEHETFVQFGRRLASLRGVEEAFSQAASVNGEISAPHILASCPHPWNRWPILMSGLIAACLLAGVLVLLYSKRSVKPAPM
ncbi:MAG TPA: hypothetical protein VFP79_13150 [Pseudolabrys sp.]|jgi:hypothetical protein|nr:hypothetical protein [Pseudolabrys sp.]